MDKFLRLGKAFFIASALLFALAVCLALAVWTKGLFLLLMFFGIIVYVIYIHIENHEHSVRKEDRKWGI
jgi:hypothetical protein